jgi:N-acetylneuraminic acid mutarotase
MAGVVFQDKMWLIDGARLADVWTSSDGAAWTKVTQAAPFPGRFGHCALVFNDRLWILGGYGSAGTPVNDVWSSADGVTWTQVTAAAVWSPRDNFGCVVYDGKIWVIDGARLGDVYSSSDGADWTSINPTTSFSRTQAHGSVVWKADIYVLGGNGDTGMDMNRVFYSRSGVFWNEVADVHWTPRAFFATVVFRDKVWVIDGNTRLGDVWKME